MPHSDTQVSRTPGVGLITVGAALFGMAASGAWAAAEHMAAAAALCGPVARHCILCMASAGGVLASAGVVAAGVMLLEAEPSVRRARVPASRRD